MPGAFRTHRCRSRQFALKLSRKFRLDTVIPAHINDDEVVGSLGPMGPLGRVFRSGLPEYCPDVRSYSAGEFPHLKDTIQLGIRRFLAWPVFQPPAQHCIGVLEIAFMDPTNFSLRIPSFHKEMDWRFCHKGGLFYKDIFDSLYLKVRDKPGPIEIGLQVRLDMVHKIHSLPFGQIWIPPRGTSSSICGLIAAGTRSCDSSIYGEFADASYFSYIQTGKAVLGRAFSSQESCFCEDVTLLSLTEYPLVPSARKAGLTQCFAICLRSKRDNSFVCVVEYFVPPKEMVDRDAETFLNMLLSTMKEQLPGFIVASGKELGQRMLVEVVKVSSSELDSFEIGQPLPIVQSLQDGGETTDIESPCQQSNFWSGDNNDANALLVSSCSSHNCDPFNCEGPMQVDMLIPSVQSLPDGGETTETDTVRQQPNLQNGENNVATAVLVLPCSSKKHDSFNKEGPMEVDLLPQPPTEAPLTNRRIDVDVAHEHIEIDKDTSEMMQIDAHFQQPYVEIDSTGNGRINDKVEHSDTSRCGSQLVEDEAINRESDLVSGATHKIQKIYSRKKDAIVRIRKDHGITLEKLKQLFGRPRKDAAEALNIHVSTLKRICRLYGITRWPHHRTRKVHPQVRLGVSLQDVEPYVGDQELPNPCDSVMTVTVTYRDDIIKFKLTPSSTRVELEGKVEKGFNISLAKFSIKYQDKDDKWILITSDSDLRDGMDELRLLKRTTMRLLIAPKSDT